MLAFLITQYISPDIYSHDLKLYITLLLWKLNQIYQVHISTSYSHQKGSIAAFLNSSFTVTSETLTDWFSPKNSSIWCSWDDMMCSHAQCGLKLDIFIEEILEKPTEIKHQFFSPSINQRIVRKFCGPELFRCYGMKTVMTQFHIKRKRWCVLPLCHIQAFT